MDKKYQLYCLADRLFYDAPGKRLDQDAGFTTAKRPLPPGWRKSRQEEWVVCTPPANTAPHQGWKVHVSACLGNAEDVLGTVWDYCTSHGISFKFLRGRLTLLIRNAKYAPRGSSGKLVTIYPADDMQLETILTDLSERLEGQPGPYILSDLRYGRGPLYVRYGGFAQRYCEDDRGETVHAIEDGSGRLVPDVRGPAFAVPEWASLPEFLRPHLAARNAVTMAGLPYQVERAMHFSNGGGVYLATDTRTGDQVVLKEARPHAGLSADGADAVARLQREHDILCHLAGLAVVPGVRDYFEVGEHHFLALDFIDGQPLNSFFAQRHPLIGHCPDPARTAEYTAWAMGICAGVEAAAAAIHDRGVVVNDLHMFNVMVRPDDTVALIDFEVAAHTWEQRRATIGNQGFLAPAGRSGTDADRYSLGCLRLAMFLPLTTLFPLQPDKAAQLAQVIPAYFPVPGEFLGQALDAITGQQARAGAVGPGAPGVAAPVPAGSTPDRRGLRQAVGEAATAVMASATPQRDDRLFPGDVQQFAHPAGGLSLGYGAAGVLYALSQAGERVWPDHEAWLATHATEPERGSRIGLYDGLLGVAYVLYHLGHTQAALKTAELCLGEDWERLGSGLHGGLAGVALVLAHLGDALAEPGLSDAGENALHIVASRGAGHVDGNRGGLMYGASGPALLFVRSFERTGDAAYLDLAAEALHSDLGRCVTTRTGALQVDEGWRTMPYLGQGSVGIGLVIDEYLRHRHDERMASAVAGIELAARSRYYAQSGLFSGRAGMIFYLARHGRAAGAEGAGGRPAGARAGCPENTGPDNAEPDVAEHVRKLAWHAVQYGGGTAFPGDGLYRLSMDLATGTAGVLLSLAVAADPDLPGLPFLGCSADQPSAGQPLARTDPPGAQSPGSGKTDYPGRR
ncbi:MAG TPA: class III lanthionine synthetase LanKC [Streptosporangiaceae bacterium]|nr:class III lanthionine synthetase LanKC [Streptosporangiaceae bacterium]